MVNRISQDTRLDSDAVRLTRNRAHRVKSRLSYSLLCLRGGRTLHPCQYPPIPPPRLDCSGGCLRLLGKTSSRARRQWRLRASRPAARRGVFAKPEIKLDAEDSLQRLMFPRILNFSDTLRQRQLVRHLDQRQFLRQCTKPPSSSRVNEGSFAPPPQRSGDSSGHLHGPPFFCHFQRRGTLRSAVTQGILLSATFNARQPQHSNFSADASLFANSRRAHFPWQFQRSGTLRRRHLRRRATSVGHFNASHLPYATFNAEQTSATPF